MDRESHEEEEEKMGEQRKNGSRLEGMSLEVGGLMQQETNGEVEHVRRMRTYQADGGIDAERYIKNDFDYFKYINELKHKKEDK